MKKSIRYLLSVILVVSMLSLIGCVVIIVSPFSKES